MRRIVLALVLICSLLAVEVSAEIPSTIRVGETTEVSTQMSVVEEIINEVDHVRELYGMCALKDPNGDVVWSKDSIPVSRVSGFCKITLEGQSCEDSYGFSCSVSWTFDKEGTWKLGQGIGYIDKTWNSKTKEWIINKGLSASESNDIGVTGIPKPPETSQELLRKLFDMFLSSF